MKYSSNKALFNVPKITIYDKIRTSIRWTKEGFGVSTIRFIHTADLHLDSPFKGMTGLPMERLNYLRDSTFMAFANLIDHAIGYKARFYINCRGYLRW